MQDRANELYQDDIFVSANEDHFEESINEVEAESTVQTHNEDLRDKVNNRLESHSAVQQSVLLRAKVQMVALPADEKQMKKAYEQVVQSFSLDKEEYPFEKFQSLAVGVDEKQFRAAMIESIPAEHLRDVANQDPSRAETKMIDTLPLEYEFQEEKQLLAEELREIDVLEADRHHEALTQELEDPYEKYLEMQNELDTVQAELDKIAEMEALHEQATQDVAQSTSLNSMEDKIEFLYGESASGKVATAEKMMNADSLSEAHAFADANAQGFKSAVENHGGKENEAFTASQMQSFIEKDFDALGEKDMVGARDATGGDNDLRKAAKRAVATGKVNDEYYDLQAQEVSGLDEETLAHKAELEAKFESLDGGIISHLEQHEGEIVNRLEADREALGLENTQLEYVEDLAASAREIQVERERVRQMETQLEYDDGLNLNR